MASEDLELWSERIYYALPDSGMATPGQILTWLQYNPYRLNGAFGTTYEFTGSGIDPALLTNHSGVYEEMYYCQLLRKQAMLFVGVNAFDLDLVETEMDGQSRQRFVSRNERAKVYRSLAKDCEENLIGLIDEIDGFTEGSDSAQILFSDRQNMVYGNSCYCPARGSFSPYNTVFSQFYKSE